MIRKQFYKDLQHFIFVANVFLILFYFIFLYTVFLPGNKSTSSKSYPSISAVTRLIGPESLHIKQLMYFDWL